MSGPVNARSVYDMNALRGGAVVKRRLGASPDGVDYVIVAGTCLSCASKWESRCRSALSIGCSRATMVA
jgi:hypothetical protein